MRVRNRAGAVALAMTSSSGLIDETATVGSTDATTRRSAAPRLAFPSSRTARKVESHGICASGTYT